MWIAQLPDSGAPTTAYAELKWVKVADDFEAGYEYVANEGSIFLFSTNRDAPKKRIVKVDITQPGMHKN